MKFFNCVCLLLLLFCVSVYADSMMYKKNEQQKYEAELVAVSSTVIPLKEYEVNAGIKSKDEYKKAYIKLFGKKVEKEKNENPDTLITLKKLLTKSDEKEAKIKNL